MRRDYIVEEVRKHRRDIEEEGDNDFGKIIANAIENEKKWALRRVSKSKQPKRARNSRATTAA